jgi:hypothetical protein
MPKAPKITKDRYEFIRHFRDENDVYVTDIWYDNQTKQFTSVVSDLEPVTFSTVMEIELFLKNERKPEKS